MKYVLIALLLVITGCSKPVEEWTTKTVSLKDTNNLKDCTFTQLDIGSRMFYVVRCPNSDTSTTSDGKNPDTVTTVDNATAVETADDQQERFAAKERLDAAQQAYNELITKHME